MRLTLFSDYTLRVLLYVGIHPQRLTTVADIAKAYGISRNHLMKVVQHLAAHGHLETLRGKGGGLRLARPAGEINIGKLLRETEQETALVECFDAETSECRITGACPLQGVFGQALQAFYQVLERHTLEDLLRDPAQLESLLTPRPSREEQDELH